MAQTNNSIEMLKKRLMAEFARDKKKAVILIALTLLAVFYVGKLVLKSAPSDAAAAVNPVAGNTPLGMPSPLGLGGVTAQTPASHGVKIDKSKGGGWDITRDIFMPDPAIFPFAEKIASAQGKVRLVEDAQGKRDAKLRLKRELIQAQGAELHLESTIAGRTPIAIINGAVVGLGGEINGFRVVKIDSQTCEVRKDGITLSLTME